MGEIMNRIAIEGGRKTFKRHVRQQWNTVRDAGLDAISRWRDRSAGVVHGTYGVTNLQAASQIRFVEEIRRGYAPKIVA
jgi:hypothetical protein